MDKWKNIFKSWVGVPVLILLVLGGLWLFTAGTFSFNPDVRAWKKLMKGYEDEYKQRQEQIKKDIYGGKTPEETYDLFIAALKKGDTELAAKYFIIEDQTKWSRTFSEYNNSGSLNSFAKELENTKGEWKKSEKSTQDVAYFEYINIVAKDKEVEYEGQKLVIPAGSYTNSTNFIKYPTGIWKIESL
ncbi:MAG: hypothetical protein WD989_00465 [Candidatus Paceibacterota bacterium]